MKQPAFFPALFLLAVSLVTSARAAEKLSAPELIALAKAHSPRLQADIEDTFTGKDLRDGTAWSGHGSDFFFAVNATSARLW